MTNYKNMWKLRTHLLWFQDNYSTTIFFKYLEKFLSQILNLGS